MRQQQNMTQKQLASTMNVSNQLISKWETGEAVPALEYIESLCKIFDCEISQLVDDININKPVHNNNAYKNIFIEQKIPKYMKYVFIGGFGLFVLLTIIFLTIFNIVPAINKNKYLEEFDNYLINSLDVGYYNMKLSTYIDGDHKENTDMVIYGYIDDNGINYYNSSTQEAVKNGIFASRYGRAIYYNYNNISTLPELFASQLEAVSNNYENFIPNNDYITYIRKTNYGFYIEFDLKDMPSDFSDNIVGKPCGKIIIRNKKFISLSMEMTIKDNDKKTHKTKGIFEFINQKPEVPNSYFVGKQWYFNSDKFNTKNEFFNTLFQEECTPQVSNEIIAQKLKSYNPTISENGQHYFMDDSKIYFTSPDTLELIHECYYVNPIKQYDNKFNAYSKVNGYTLEKHNNTIYVYDQNNDSVVYQKNTNDISSCVTDSFYAKDGYLFYIGTSSGYNTLFKENMATGQIANFSLRTYLSLERKPSSYYYGNYNYNDDYFYMTTHENYNDKSVVININAMTRTLSFNGYVEYVDAVGNCYYKDSYSSTTLNVYNNSLTIQNANDICEDGEFVYVKTTGSPQCVYQLKDVTVYDSLVVTYGEAKPDYYNVGERYYYLNGNELYDNNGLYYTFDYYITTFSGNQNILNSGAIYFYSPKIIGNINGKIIVTYSRLINTECIAFIYDPFAPYLQPLAVTSFNNLCVSEFENRIYITYTDTDNNFWQIIINHYC